MGLMSFFKRNKDKKPKKELVFKRRKNVKGFKRYWSYWRNKSI